MKKVYAIIYEELYSDGSYSSGLSYIFNNMKKAKNMLDEIKEEELKLYTEEGSWNKDDILKEHENEFMLDFSDEYTKYKIIEKEVI